MIFCMGLSYTSFVILANNTECMVQKFSQIAPPLTEEGLTLDATLVSCINRLVLNAIL